ncbi:hypothetical protein [Ekhidna sp.]
MNKRLGIASILIGLIVLGFIIHFNLRFYELQSQFENVSYFVYGRTNKRVLFVTVLVGLVLGGLSIKKHRNNFGIIGLVICIVDFLKLLSQSN